MHQESKTTLGLTLIELLVVLAIIGLLSAITYAGFDQARAQSRDKVRMSTLKEVQLAVEQYRAQRGYYPPAGCGAGTTTFAGPGTENMAGFTGCTTANTYRYIEDLVPAFIGTLPFDVSFEFDRNKGIFYRSDGASYKLMLYDVVETLRIDELTDEFARCPSASGACASGVPSTTYAVYSIGAEDW